MTTCRWCVLRDCPWHEVAYPHPAECDWWRGGDCPGDGGGEQIWVRIQ